MPARTSAQIPDDLLIVDPALEAIRKESSKNKVDSSTVSVFLPATVINIAYCPPELRVLFLNCVFFGWVIYLSLFLNEDKGAEA